VHCESGLRASIGASLIDRSGRDVVYIDDDYAHAAVAGFVTT
jgi:hydroxyacylglutathione hydrolase